MAEPLIIRLLQAARERLIIRLQAAGAPSAVVYAAQVGSGRGWEAEQALASGWPAAADAVALVRRLEERRQRFYRDRSLADQARRAAAQAAQAAAAESARAEQADLPAAVREFLAMSEDRSIPPALRPDVYLQDGVWYGPQGPLTAAQAVALRASWAAQEAQALALRAEQAEARRLDDEERAARAQWADHRHPLRVCRLKRGKRGDLVSHRRGGNWDFGALLLISGLPADAQEGDEVVAQLVAVDDARRIERMRFIRRWRRLPEDGPRR